MAYDIWLVQDIASCKDARELSEQTGQRHIAVEQGSELEARLLATNPATR
jgi:hypothetical protein